MNIPIVKWTNPMTKEVFTDKVSIPFKKSFTEIFVSKVFCSDILDAITKDFFARKQHTHDDTMHVEDLQVLYSPQKIYI